MLMSSEMVTVKIHKNIVKTQTMQNGLPYAQMVVVVGDDGVVGRAW
jgi:hypothetical protein